ncbi:MAG: adenosylcobinamide-phosphate synthase CbiB, partial [Clostridiales bacterium]|nr:adenosylcobinamide-phosphate synthase CbiB [Clostridiales bacterium]
MDLSAFLLNYTSYLLAALIIGYIADLIIGDPHGIWHPICLIGSMISCFERGLRKVFHCEYQGKSVREFAAGICLVILVLACSAALPSAILLICYRIHWILGLAMQSYMSYTILATKSLRVESMKVYTALKAEGLQAGRQAVSMIVGRDTEALDETGVVKAAVETVAENTSDGVIAPLLFLVIGGPVLGYFYKAVNTMDSMVGYKNEKYRHFGMAAARLDDVLNFLPARISALLMIGAAFLLSLFGKMVSGFRTDGRSSFRMNGENAWRIWRRDRRNHA